MPQMGAGYGIFGLIRGIIDIALAVAFIWLLFKLGKLADAYANKLKAKTQ